MLFRTFEGQFMLSLHTQKAGWGKERAVFIPLREEGDRVGGYSSVGLFKRVVCTTTFENEAVLRPHTEWPSYAALLERFSRPPPSVFMM
jgi:hypothetical protein